MAEHATQAVTGYGSKLELGNGDGPPETFDQVYDLTGFEPPDEKVDTHDVSHFESPGGVKEKIAGMIDAGEATFDVNYNPAVYEIHQRIMALKASRAVANWKFSFPDGMETDIFPAFVSGFKPKLGPNDPLTATITLTLAGLNVRTFPEIS
jgi:hypothetical protein